MPKESGTRVAAYYLPGHVCIRCSTTVDLYKATKEYLPCADWSTPVPVAESCPYHFKPAREPAREQVGEQAAAEEEHSRALQDSETGSAQ